MDVIVVGAGPAGLLLAGDLAAAGVSCTILERRTEESPLTRAFAVHARTLELLDARGVADELIATGQRVDDLQLLGKLRIDLSRLPSRFRFVLITPQYQTERVLEERARKLGADIVRGVEVTGLRQDPDGVAVDVRSADGTTHTRHAAFVVGADGVHSTVRAALGLPFPGQSAVQSVMLADVRLTEQPPDILSVNASGDAFGFVVPYGDGWYRVICWEKETQLPDDAPVDLAEIRRVTRRVLGTDYGMHDARWLSRFHSDERQAPRYRVGRVLLVGDAAHVHSPAGGQGMNTGLQDAANLSWKLAAAVRGWGPPGLLDTYQDERHPVGVLVLRSSGALVRTAMLARRPLTVVSTVAGLAARIPAVASRAAGVVTGIGIRYRRPRGAHPLVGERAADVALTGGSRLYEALRVGGFVLVTPVTVDGLPDRVTVTAKAAPTSTTVLVRPDGYIAWAAEHATAERIRDAVRRYAGT